MTDSERVVKCKELIMQYGGIDGAHHKDWVLDQCLRVLCDESEYKEFVSDPDYTHDEGIPP